MTDEVQKALKAAGYRFGTAQEFLGLTDDENAEVESIVVPIIEFNDRLRTRFPDLEIEVNLFYGRGRSAWQLDITCGVDSYLIIEWRKDRGFGISSEAENDPGFLSGPDEVYPDANAAFARIEALIVSGDRTVPPSQRGGSGDVIP